MPRWCSRILVKIHSLASTGRVALTRKATQELAALDLDLRPQGVGQILLGLQASDAIQRLRSEHNGSWLYVFKPAVEGQAIYLKLTVRENCVVISFHEFN
jgi:hypothetical protein